MRKILIGVCAALLAVAALWSTGVSQEASRDDGFIVHEWGTFTSMQGSDGITLEGLHHEEEALPEFVYSRTEVRECPLRDKGYKGLEVDVKNVTEKMETPVTYFYSDKPVRARVRVCFNKGLLTQWYPVSDRLGPAENMESDGPLDMSKVEKSFLEWEIDVLAKGEGEGPAVPKDDPWAFARIADSNYVRTVERKSPRMGPTETEKFLFYRGLGTFTIPIKVTFGAGSKVTIENGGDEPIRHLFLLHVTGGAGAFSYVPEVPARGSTSVVRPQPFLTKKIVDVASMVKSLLPLLKEKLVAEGLYEREAEAMVRTWERSYFHTEGFRILYCVPRSVTDKVLPIAVTPAPKSMTRVLVGRMECITPEVEGEVQIALMDLSSKDAGKVLAAKARLDRLGRFLEPHVRRVLSITKSEVVAENGLAILKKEEKR